MGIGRRFRIGLAAVTLSACIGPVHAERRVYPPDQIINWKPHAFADPTRYRLVEADGRAAVHAACTPGAASGLFLETDIDLEQTPIIEWDWRVEQVFAGLDEQTRGGDDYPARLYLVDARSIARWRTRAINYVWSSTLPESSRWPNAYASQAIMIAVRSGASEETAGWKTERRDLRADFQGAHGAERQSLNTLAIMTDCDNGGQSAEAWYGEIRLLPDEP